jgi:quinoprotein glucose dehydrogenase
MTMTRRVNRRHVLGLTLLLGALSGGAFLVHAHQSAAAPKPVLVRGNAPGEWRYWAADAWSTRYSPLDQINAANFNSLQVAWKWNANAFGEDEYFRSTPLFANGRLFSVAGNRRVAAAIDPANGETIWMYRLEEGIRWQKAARQYSGRGLAYWTDGRSERVGHGPARSEVRQERRRRSHGRTGLSARPAGG